MPAMWARSSRRRGSARRSSTAACTRSWRKQWISDEPYESVGVADVDGDGVLDLVSGAWWYQGPDFRRKHRIGEVMACGEYHDDFSTIFIDVSGDGRPDLVTGGYFGRTLQLRRNPGRVGEEWPLQAIAELGPIETTRAWDLDGDGVLEIVPNCPGSRTVQVARLDRERDRLAMHTVHEFADGAVQGHGLGCGDLAGNGRRDLAFVGGWLEAPADPWAQPWIWHGDAWTLPWRAPSVPMLVVDLDGDGESELIVGNAHGYGLSWFDRDADGRWREHPIDPGNAQYHDLHWVDLDGDGAMELVTGKRHRAHNGNDPGEWDDYGISYFTWTGQGFARQIVDWGPLGCGASLGIHAAIADLTGDGRPDIVAPGKDGLYVYYNLGPTPARFPG